MNKTDFNHIYRQIGKILCSGAGGIVGFIAGGPLLVLPGIIAGFIGSHAVEKAIA